MAYWKVKSKWDYVAFIAPFQWLALLLGVVFLLFGSMAIGGLLIVIGVYLNFFSLLMPLATILGSNHHEHLQPTKLYHMAALLFGPIVGLHYLYRTANP